MGTARFRYATFRHGVAIVLTLAAATPSPAATLTVGDTGCDTTTVQAAITAASGVGPHLIKLKTMTFSAQAINLAGKSIRFVGGYANCGAATSTGTTTLSGNGGAAASVLTITGGGNDVILENLAIIQGDEASDGTGGGIDFRGDGTLTLRKTAVSQNYAGYGAGINVAPGNSAEVALEAGSVVLGNTAQYSGGGIRLEGASRLYVLQDQTLIQGNEAMGVTPGGSPSNGYGGGVELIAPAKAYIGSPGYGTAGVISYNTARFGGGISLHGTENNGEALAFLFTTVPDRPVRLHGNRATQAGGGVFLDPYIDLNDTSYARLQAQDFRFGDNHAPQGSAIHLATDSFGGVEVGGDAALGGRSYADYGAVACATGIECNLIEGNVTDNAAQQLQPGATIFVDAAGSFNAQRLALRGNRSAQLLRQTGTCYVTMFNLLAAGNQLDANAFANQGGTLTLLNATIAGNAIAAAHTIASTGSFVIRRSIIDQPGVSTLSLGGGTYTASDVIASDTVSLGGGANPTLLAAAPRFVDPAHGDYHLQAGSQGVDYAADGGGPAPDLDGATRGTDLALVPNRFGAGDLGAYELPAVSNLVLNRGFIEDLRLWDVVTAGVTSWIASGAASAGAVRISKSPIASGELVGLSQCIHIPGPGTYRLSAFAYGAGQSFERDSVSVRWRQRNTAGAEICNGAVLQSGALAFPSNASTWAPASAPEFITVTPAQWSRYATVELQLVVVERGLNINGDTTGYFDGVVLEPFDIEADRLFADGFE